QTDLHKMVVLERPPPDGVLGRPGPTGEARLDEDRSEEVRINVRADAPGFLVLTDQDYPGWEATLNGAPATPLRANHACRAAAVRAGESTVGGHYRGRAVWVGVTVSLLTLVGVMVAVARAAR